MIKLIILSFVGRDKVSSRKLFNSIKTYLIFYMLVLPGLITASVFSSGSANVPESVEDLEIQLDDFPRADDKEVFSL